MVVCRKIFFYVKNLPWLTKGWKTPLKLSPNFCQNAVFTNFFCFPLSFCPLCSSVTGVSACVSWWKWWSQTSTLWPTTWSRSGCIRRRKSSWSKGSTVRCWKQLRGCTGLHGSPSSRGSTLIALFSPGDTHSPSTTIIFINIDIPVDLLFHLEVPQLVNTC